MTSQHDHEQHQATIRKRNLITAALLVLFFTSLIIIAISSSLPSS